MKYSKQILALFLLQIVNISISLSVKKLNDTPKALGLSNHFGTEPSANQFGPKSNKGANLRREGATPGSSVTPITNFEKEINTSQVVSGSLDNTAFDAGKIVKVSLATPKAEIKSVFHHEAVVKTPVHLGNQIDEKTMTVMNRVNGKIESKRVTTEKPILGLLNTVRNVETHHTTVVDLNTGKVLPHPSAAEKINHGTE